MYKVFIHDKPLEVIHVNDSYQLEENYLVLRFFGEHDIEASLFLLEKVPTLRKLILLADKPQEAFELVKKKFQIIEAAGGLVYNNEGKYLFIKRFEKWDLPKGKLEKGESITDCAIREVEEECLVSKLKIIKTLPTTHHCYTQKGKDILKISNWFLMSCDEFAKMQPQTEEGITELKWIDKSQFKEIYNNTYYSIRDLLLTIFPEDA